MAIRFGVMLPPRVLVLDIAAVVGCRWVPTALALAFVMLRSFLNVCLVDISALDHKTSCIK